MFIVLQIMDVIDEEEKQFLKTLSRGRKMFERTSRRLQEKTLPGLVIVYKNTIIMTRKVSAI